MMTRIATIFAALAAAALSAATQDIRTEEERRVFADALFSRSMYGMAAVEYRQLLANHPEANEADALNFRLGESLRLTGDLDGAITAFSKVAYVKGSQYRQRAAFKRAAIFLDPKVASPENASYLFGELLKEPDLAPDIRELALYYSGEALLQAGDKAAARKSFDELIAKFPQGSMTAFGKISLGRLIAEPGDGHDPKRSERLLREVASDPAAGPRLAAEALFLLFRAKFAEGDFKAAAAVFTELRTKHPGDGRVAESRLQSAWAYLKAGLCDSAMEICRSAAADAALGAAQKAEYRYILATAHFQLLRYDEAADAYGALAADPAAGAFARKSWYQLALCRFRTGAFDGAVSALKNVVEDPEMREDSLWLMAEAAAGKGDADLAVQNYRLLTEIPSTKFGADPYYRLAHQLQTRKSWLEASVYYIKLTEAFPQSPLVPKALFASATCLSLGGQGLKALRDWDEYLRRFPDDDGAPEAFYQKALEEIRQDRKTDALATLDTLAARHPGSARRPDAQFWRGQLLREKKSFADAEKAYRAALAANPSDDIGREAKFALAQTLQLLERDDAAAALFQELISDPIRSKFTPHQFAWLAERQFDKKDYANSDKTARTLATQTEDPKWKQVAWTFSGRALRALGDAAGAKKAFAAAAAIDFESKFLAESRLALGDLALSAGDHTEAARQYGGAAALASAPELATLRVLAYRGLGDAALAGGTREGREAAVKYYMTVSMFYKNDEIIPPILAKAIPLLDSLGLAEEAAAMRGELFKNYPSSAEAARIKAADDLPAATVKELD